MFLQQSPALVLRIVRLKLAVYDGQEATLGQCCGSAFYLASLVCKYS